MLLTKTDLIPGSDFNFGRFSRIVQRMNPDAPLITLSLLTGQGLDQWIAWLRAKREAAVQ
jgi:hydrogenase nickel incorporation protein HypB